MTIRHAFLEHALVAPHPRVGVVFRAVGPSPDTGVVMAEIVPVGREHALSDAPDVGPLFRERVCAARTAENEDRL